MYKEHPGMRRHMDLRKHHYEQSQWRWWNSSDAVKVLYSICQQIGNLNNGHRTGKGWFSFQCQRKAIPKNAQITTQLHSSHMIAKLWSKFSKPDFKSRWTMNFQMFKLDLEKVKEPEIKLPTSVDHRKSQRVPERHLLLLY